MTTPDRPRSFALTWDYLCPFARNAHEHTVRGLRAGADWDVSFVPFSLEEVHRDHDDPPVWERDDLEEVSGLLALLAGITLRESDPERFPDAHLELFAARHDRGDRLREEDVVRDALGRAGVDPDAVLAEVAAGWPREVLGEEHAAAEDDGVFGVPTLILDDVAVFVRLMHRPGSDEDAIRTVERLLDLVGWRELNEFKHARIPR